MKRTDLLILLMMLMLRAFPVYAIDAGKIKEEHRIDSWLSTCLDTNPTTTGMVECGHQAYQKWDEELNKEYRALRNLLNDYGKETVRNSQRAWLSYRDAEFQTIEALYTSLEGTMWLPVLQFHKIKLVKERTLMLQIYKEDLLTK